MAKIIVTPMLGNPRSVRLDSLAGCHALFEKSEYIEGMPGNLGTSLESAVKKLLLTDDMRRWLREDHKVSFVVTIEV